MTSDISVQDNSSFEVPKVAVSRDTPLDVKIIKRKLNGYVGFANLPKQWHRKSVRKGFSLNLMAVGESGLGKKTLVNTLFNREILTEEAASEADDVTTGVQIKSTTADIEEDGVKLKLTVVTAPGFGEAINNTNSWTPIVDEINSRFDAYLSSESKATRAVTEDGRIHALLYFIEPTGHSLKALDIALMKQVHDKVNLIPIIAKSDTMSQEDVTEFKKRILDDIEHQGIKTFKSTTHELDEEETVMHTQKILQKVPFAIVGSTTEIELADGKIVRGRKYPWGIIDVENEHDSDFIYLRQLLIRNFFEELKDHTSNVLYENYRTQKLKSMNITQDDTVFKEFDPLARQEEERVLHEAKLAKMEADMKAVFQDKVSEKEKKLRKSEADLFARHKEMKEKLAKQIKLLEEKKVQLEKQKSLPQEPAAAQPPKKKGFLR